MHANKWQESEAYFLKSEQLFTESMSVNHSEMNKIFMVTIYENRLSL